ncbi:MAG TPA: lipoyl(octanoyl) transferase LipB [Dehalococcoidia bacterium]|nr:lipoyl(octanoyl) transferase LipB [Dehalococcoidia bacterium]
MRRPLRLIDLGRCSYDDAHNTQLAVRAEVIARHTPDTLLLAEHDPIVTLGRRGDRSGILSPSGLRRAGIQIVQTERGGHVTYHGPGQLVAYPVLNLHHWGTDLRRYVERLEEVAVRTLDAFAIEAWGDSEQHGVYTARGKIASIGIHVTSWVTMHGIALNVDPNMAHWQLIAPCNLPDVAATSMALELPHPPPLATVRAQFLQDFATVFDVALSESSSQ